MDLLTPAQLAEKYPLISRSLIYAACQSGGLPHYRIGVKPEARGKYAIRERDFLKWLEALRVEGGGVPSPPRTAPVKRPFRHLKL